MTTAINNNNIRPSIGLPIPQDADDEADDEKDEIISSIFTGLVLQGSQNPATARVLHESVIIEDYIPAVRDRRKPEVFTFSEKTIIQSTLNSLSSCDLNENCRIEQEGIQIEGKTFPYPDSKIMTKTNFLGKISDATQLPEFPIPGSEAEKVSGLHFHLTYSRFPSLQELINTNENRDLGTEISEEDYTKYLGTPNPTDREKICYVFGKDLSWEIPSIAKKIALETEKRCSIM